MAKKALEVGLQNMGMVDVLEYELGNIDCIPFTAGKAEKPQPK